MPGAYPHVPRAVAALRYLPAPDALVAAPAAGTFTLVTHDGTELTIALCTRLLAQGHRVAVLIFPATLVVPASLVLPAGAQPVALPDVTDEAIQAALAQLAGPVSQFLYLHPRPVARAEVGQFSGRAERTLLQAVFLLAKHLQEPLHAGADQSRPAFLTVARLDGAFGTAADGTASPLGGALFGLTKSLNLEWPAVFCRAVDLAPALSAETAADHLTQELHDADQCLVQTAYDAAGTRRTLVAEPTELLREPTLTAHLSPASVWVVTGGGRGITADCGRELAARFGGTFILLGRTTLTDQEPTWAQSATDPAELKHRAMDELKGRGEKPLPRLVERLAGDVLVQRAIRATLADLTAHGATAHYRAVDVTDAAAVRAVLDEVRPHTGPITGLLHGAGRLADKKIVHKTAADFAAVFDVKIKGLEAVMQALDPAALRHVVLFASVAGFYGNVGQTDYAMANEVLNHYTHLFRHHYPQAHAVAINWGAWDAGMVSPTLKGLLGHQVALVPSDEGPRALIDQLSTRCANQVQVVLGGPLPQTPALTSGPLRTYQVRRHLVPTDNPFLAHHQIRGYAVLPINLANAWLIQTGDALYPGFYPCQEDNVKLFKGLVFNGSQPTDFQVTVQELTKSEEQLDVLVTIASCAPGGRPVPHYQGQVQLLRQRPAGPVEPLPNLSRLTPVLADGASLYTDGTLFHGPDFQGVRQVVSLDETGALLLCEHPGLSWEQQGQFPAMSVNGFLTDIMHQGLLVWVRRWRGSACLPLGTTRVRFYQELPFGRPFYVKITVRKATDFAMTADCTAFDAATGATYLTTHEASVTINPDLTWH